MDLLLEKGFLEKQGEFYVIESSYYEHIPSLKVGIITKAVEDLMLSIVDRND